MYSKKHYGTIYTGSFCEGISPILFVVQFFGIFPLKGIRPKPSGEVHFSWFSFSSLICLGFMIWDLVIILANVYTSRHTKVLDILSSCVFFLTSLLVYVVFLRLAMRWGVIIKIWTQKEQPFLQIPYINKSSRQFKSKLLFIAIIIAVLAVGEHSLYQFSSINFYVELYSNCNISNVGFQDFIYRRFHNVHTYIPGMTPMIFCQFVTWFATAAWNFLDLFIILICVGINFRFEQFTSALRYHLKHEVPTIKSMNKFRMDFIAICELLEYIDKHLGSIVFLSVANNLNSICSMLMKAFNILRFFPDYLYYWLSLTYLILRTLCLFLSAASINESSRGPARLLHNVPQKHWNQECYRLLFQINSSTIALSAMGFFNFTRELTLTMAGAVVTFELIMLQFSTPISKLTPLCEISIM